MTQTTTPETDGDPFDGIEDLNDEDVAVETDEEPDPKSKPQPSKKSSAGSASSPTPKDSRATMLARIKPYDKRRGHLTKKFTVFGIPFQEGKGWYRVSQKVADYISRATVDGDPEGLEIFDVCTEDEAMRLEAKERKKAQMRANASAPNDAMTPRDVEEKETGTLTTRDLPGKRRSMKAG